MSRNCSPYSLSVKSRLRLLFEIYKLKGFNRSARLAWKFKGLFTWREEDPSARKILEGRTSLRHTFSVFSLHVKCCTWP